MKKFYLFIFYVISFLLSSFCWSQNKPPEIIAVGNQAYCPLSEVNIVTNFNISDPDTTQIEALFVQISSGYVVGQDVLKLANPTLFPGIITQWSNAEGKLTLRNTNSDLTDHSALIAAAKDIVFSSTSVSVSGEKIFSFTIGDANFLPATGHYYEYIAAQGISWNNAKTAAENKDYFGLQGYLATLTSQEEANFSGSQANGVGWIGASDDASQGTNGEGDWRWVTGPEAGTPFYRGQYPSGTVLTFAFWNNGEPNDSPENTIPNQENYAHITDLSVTTSPGSWNDLPNEGGTGAYAPQGYVIEYGGMTGDPVLNIAATTNIYVPFLQNILAGKNCGNGAVNLSATASSGDVLWFEAETSNSPIFTGSNFITPLLTSTTTYYVLASENGCLTGLKQPVTASIYEIPIINPDNVLKNCDVDGNPDGFTDFNLEEANNAISLGDQNLTITYYLSNADAEQKINAVNPAPFQNSTANLVYARAETERGCYAIANVKLEVSATTPGYLEELISCELDDVNDGRTTFDLTLATQNILSQLPVQNLSVSYYRNNQDAILEQNEILPQNTYTNETPYSQSLFVRVESEDNGDCYNIGENLVLTVNSRPEFEVNPSDIFCVNRDPITLFTYNPSGTYTYEWRDSNGTILGNNSTLSVAKGGIYTVIARSTLDCESLPRTILVEESSVASVVLEDITIRDNSENNTIAINDQNNNLGIGDYRYALDDALGFYQEEPLFENVTPGKHAIYVRDVNGCGTAQIDVYLIGFPKFFTPNNDGINDTWQVDGINSQPASKIYIFDKFGKLLHQVEANGPGWDGYYNGNAMPSTDYWYMVQLEDGRTQKGHFSLIRR